MVSFQASLSLDMRKTTTLELENSSKKRKLEEPLGDEETNFEKRSKAESTRSVFDMELHLETPLPLEWQRCLDIQVYKYLICYGLPIYSHSNVSNQNPR